MNIEQARRVSIADLLERSGHPVQRRTNDELWYLSPLRSEQTASFKVSQSRNIWYDFGLGQGGDAIRFVQLAHKLSGIRATLSKMDELVGGANIPQHPQRLKSSQAKSAYKSKPLTLTGNGPIKHPALFRYLKLRSISPTLAGKYLSEIHYERGDKKYFALAMPNDTGLQTGLGFEVRNAHFKGSIGPKDIRTVPGTQSPDRVEVFEGMFDFLSHLSMTKTAAPEFTSIIMNSVAMKDRTIERIHSLQPTAVDLYLDNDAAGKQLVAELQVGLPEFEVRDRSGIYAEFKDLGDFAAAKDVFSRLSMRPDGFQTLAPLKHKEHPFR